MINSQWCAIANPTLQLYCLCSMAAVKCIAMLSSNSVIHDFSFDCVCAWDLLSCVIASCRCYGIRLEVVTLCFRMAFGRVFHFFEHTEFSYKHVLVSLMYIHFRHHRSDITSKQTLYTSEPPPDTQRRNPE